METIEGKGTNITIVLPTADLMDRSDDNQKTDILEIDNP